MYKTAIFSCAILSIALIGLSCKNGATNNYYQGAGPSSQYSVVTDNPTAIISYAGLANLPRGTAMRLRVNRNNFEVWEVNVVFDALYTVAPDRLILCHTNSDFPIGAGDSGSPLLTSDGKIAGILCYGYDGNSNDFAARAIEDVLSIDSSIVSLPSSSTVFSEIQPVYVVSGYNAQAASKYPRLGKVLGKYTMQSGTPFATQNNLSKIANNLAIPGSSIAVMYISGDNVNEMAIGTMSYIGNGNIFAFGHSFESFLAAPTYLASTGSFINSYTESFKMSEPSTQLVGSFVINDYNGVLIKQNVQPLVAQLSTSCSINGQTVFSYHHQISNTPSFVDDKDFAANLSCYLVYENLVSLNKEADSTVATCTAQIMSDQESKNVTFVLRDNYIDGDIYSYLEDSLLTASSSKELKIFNLSVNLEY
ncbi:MAG: hypothetical protein WBZ48_08885 [Bacteroidota bacterium]